MNDMPDIGQLEAVLSQARPTLQQLSDSEVQEITYRDGVFEVLHRNGLKTPLNQPLPDLSAPMVQMLIGKLLRELGPRLDDIPNVLG